VEVKEILTESTVTSKNFLIRGGKIVLGNYQHILYHVDFSNYHERECVFPDDYEDWSPADPLGHCLLGQKVIYSRRIRNALCFVPADMDHRKPGVQYCTCTQEDYECDYCYDLDEEQNTCYFYCSNHSQLVEPDNCTGVWYKTKGYRKVSGNMCVDDKTSLDKWAPTAVNCTGPPPVTTIPGTVTISGGVVFVIVLFILVILVVAVFFLVMVLARFNPNVKVFLDRTFPQFLQPCWSSSPRGKRAINKAAGYDVLGSDKDGGSLLDDSELFVEDEGDEPAAEGDDDDDDDKELTDEPDVIDAPTKNNT